MLEVFFSRTGTYVKEKNGIFSNEIFFPGLVLSDIYEASAKIKAAIILVRLFFSKGFLFDEDD